MLQTYLYLSPSPGSKLHPVFFFPPYRAGAAPRDEAKYKPFANGSCSLLLVVKS